MPPRRALGQALAKTLCTTTSISFCVEVPILIGNPSGGWRYERFYGVGAISHG